MTSEDTQIWQTRELLGTKGGGGSPWWYWLRPFPCPWQPSFLPRIQACCPCSIAKHTHTIRPILSYEVAEIVQHKRNRPTPVAAAKCLCHAGAMDFLQSVKLILRDDPQYPSQKAADTPRWSTRGMKCWPWKHQVRSRT